jgi:hypothetical protein
MATARLRLGFADDTSPDRDQYHRGLLLSAANEIEAVGEGLIAAWRSQA